MSDGIPNWLKKEARKSGKTPSELCLNRALKWINRFERIESSNKYKEVIDDIEEDLDNKFSEDKSTQNTHDKSNNKSYFCMDDEEFQNKIEQELKEREKRDDDKEFDYD